MKKILIVVGIALVALMFLVGFIIGTRNNNGDVTDNILRTVAPQIISKLGGNPQTLITLSSCPKGSNCVGETSTPPYQWLRYAQYYYTKSIKQTVPTEEILSDLFLYPESSYYQRLYQYGDIIVDSKIADAKYQEKYLELFDKSIHPSYFTISEDFIYYSQTDNIYQERLQGSQIAKDKNNGVMVMDNSTNAVAAANAYSMTKDEKYLNVLNNYLNSISFIYYFDGKATASIVDSPKYSVCYSLLATSKAFSVTNNRQYLQLTDDLILGQTNYLQQFYQLKPSQMEQFTSIPMNVLPCLDALNLLMANDTQNSAIYSSTYDTVINFLITNKILNSSSGSDLYGMMLIDDKVDINSTAWSVKILSENKIINEK